MADLQHHCSVTLIVTGEDLDPDEVTRILKMEPHASWRRGDRKFVVNRDGEIRYLDHLYKFGGWNHELPEKYSENRSLVRQLALWLTRLETLAEELKSLTARGWEVELDCFAASSEVLVLHNRTLRKLADLGLDFSLTINRESDPALMAKFYAETTDLL